MDQDQRKATKECDQKIFLTQEQRELSLLNKPDDPYGQSLEPKLPQSEPQPQPYQLINNVSKLANVMVNGKLCILGGNELEWYKKVTNTTKQCKIGYKDMYYCAILSCRPHSDIKEVKILTKSDVLPRTLRWVLKQSLE